MTGESGGRGRRWALALGAALVGVLVFVLLGDDETEEADEAVQEVRLAPDEPPPAAPPTATSDPVDRDIAGNPIPEGTLWRPGMPAGALLEEGTGRLLRRGLTSGAEAYRISTQYPPTSRPLTHEAHGDRIDWNARHDQARPAQEDPDVTFLYTADRYWLIGDGPPIQSYLKVQRGDEILEDVQVLAARARVIQTRGDPIPEREPIALEYRWDGEKFVNELPPSTFSFVDRAVRVRMEILFAWGENEHEASAGMEFVYNPPNAISGRFTGRFRDQLEEGSLAVYAEVEIADAGWYNIDANLFGAEGETTAYARYKGDIEAGVTEVRLLFFGKAIRDSRGTEPPWEVRQLRGVRLEEDSSPASFQMEPFEGTYRTARYDLEELSAEEWDSEQRRETLAALEADDDAPPVPLSPADLEARARGETLPEDPSLRPNEDERPETP